MIIKKFLLLVTFFLFCANLLSAATFTVTSNADAGPGTLREALLNAAANGTATQDIIVFALPGSLVSDRIIRLKTQLPYVSSNLVIDGTTQTGAVFGVSDARVIIEPETSPASFNCLTINGDIYNNYVAAKNVEIYGLYIRNFDKVNRVDNPNNFQGSGIYIIGDASSITIGAPGKGNVICGNSYGIANSSYNYYNGVSDITIQSNIIGLLDDGFTANSNIYGVSLSVNQNAKIGGPNANMGNVISANAVNINIARIYNFTTPTNALIIQNNKIGTNFDGNADFKNIPLFVAATFGKLYGILIDGSNGLLVKIINNIISGQRYYGIYIDNATFEIEGNKIGTDKTGTADLGNGAAIRVGTNASGNIGGTAASTQNIIAYNSYGIDALNNAHALISRNSIFCNKEYGISVVTNYYQVPFVKVISFSSTTVSGLATPNSKIELFYADACGYTNCQGKTYITTINANANGEWTYSGTISSPVIATATDGNNNTSPFSSLEIADSDIEIKQFTCAYKGSVTIKPAFTGLLFHWDKKEQNGTLTSLADTKSVADLQPGTYQLTVQYPGGCQKSTRLFIINDQRIKIQNTLPPTPECRQKFFPVDVNYQGGTGNVTFVWKNTTSGNTYPNKQAIVPGGTYTVTISDEAGCSVTSAPFTITPKPGPDYDLSTMNVATARCGIAEGSIKDITTYVGIGTLTYQWYDSNNTLLPGKTSKDLVGVKGGLYRLELRDQSQCSPYSTPLISIQETNSVNISDAFRTPATCGLNNGAIQNVYVDNADFFQWTGPNGQIPTTPTSYHNIGPLAEGQYTLYAKNTSTGCDNSRTFTVVRLQPETFSYSQNITPATCNSNNGIISLQFNGNVIPQSLQWVDANGTPRGNNNQIIGLEPGVYTLITTDRYNCQNTLGSFEVKNTPLLTFADTNNPTPTADECNQSLGHIDGVAVTGGIQPYTYTWTNELTGEPVGGNTPSLNGIGKGTYRLKVTDATPCAEPLVAEHIEVGNIQFVPASPILTDRRICSPETVNLAVINRIEGNYNLYATATATVPLQKSSRGAFNIAVAETSDYYVSYNIGTCESLRTKVHVEVILIDVKFGNAFTPNQDGTNDYWKITGLEKFPGSTVQVFTRGGLKVFESKQYATPFEGKQGGTVLPAGVYYYIINLNTPCELLSGSVTIIR